MPVSLGNFSAPGLTLFKAEEDVVYVMDLPFVGT